MSDYAIPEAAAEPGAGDEQPQAGGAEAPHPAPASPPPAPATAPLSGEDADPDQASRAAAASLRTLLETAVTRRSVDEVADLVTLLRGTGHGPDAADQALRAAAVGRPIEDVISLAVLLAGEDEPQQRPSEDQRESEPRSRARKRTGRAPREASKAEAERTVAGRVMRWPVAVTLTLSALLYLPRRPASLLAHTGLSAWLLLGLAVLCLALAVLVTVRDRAWVWSVTTGTGIGLVGVHAVATLMGLDLWGSAAGGLLPWPTGAAMLAAGLTAVLSVMALRYRQERQRPAPGLPVAALPDTGSDPLDGPPAPTPDLAHETEASAP
ncbi:hypothetical protein [Streptomyces subrutilus]|uniref:Uncharacterized protein n=1 Tax=Streptomyces subrutilus TaxID=36818 RepID=A0A1E5PLK3_9ACTN|nr:hypothetical protein [Streptomyces subrutilus]OEJ30333.1 hypothetical protein BGK67_02260 [Streptomyces subrutilus]